MSNGVAERCLTVGASEHTFAQGLKGRECRVILEGDKMEKRFVYDGKERCISLVAFSLSVFYLSGRLAQNVLLFSR